MLAAMLVASLTFTIGCGGGGGRSELGDRVGTDTAPRVIGLQTPSGLQGTRGVAPDTGWVNILYNLQDREYDWCAVTVEYGFDQNGDGLITDGTDDGFGNPTPNEFAPATPAPEFDDDGVKVHDGAGPLNSSPGAGALHSYTWDSVADLGTARHLTQDYVYTTDGRIDTDKVTGDIRFEVFPGVVIRIMPDSDGSTGPWAYSNGMSVNNNNTPTVTITGVEIPPEGQADGTVNEDVAIDWVGVDPDGDTITIAVDIAILEDEDSYKGMSEEELATLPWQDASTSLKVGEGTFQLDATPAPGQPHVFGWDSLSDVAQQRIPVLVRIRPLDGKRETGPWAYAPAHFNLDNYTTFMAPDTDNNELPEGRIGAVATTLDTGNVLVTGGSGTGDKVGLNGGVVYYVLQKNPYGNLSATNNTMAVGRTYHTATRLLGSDPEDPLSAKVLLTGGYDENGNPTDSAEIYDPASNTFTECDSKLSTPRAGHCAILLRSGKVLLVGGVKDKNENAASFLDTAEIFDPLADASEDPVKGSFTLVEEAGAIDKMMGTPRADAGALLMPAADTAVGAADREETDLVLIVGGRDHNGALKSIEVFDALTETFLATDAANDMAEARWGLSLSATMDETYAAVVAGGQASPPKNTIEVYDPASMTWMTSLAKMDTARSFHSSALMGDGRILLAGGQSDEAGTNLNRTANIYDVSLEMKTRAMYDDPDTPEDESVTDTPADDVDDFIDTPNGDLRVPSRMAAVTVLENGFVAMFGGDTALGASKELQLFSPDQGFNTAPSVEVASPDANTPEPWAFGVRIYYRLVDTEGDPARIVAQYKVLESAKPGDATQLTTLNGEPNPWLNDRKDDLGKWLPATMQANTVLGDQSTGTSGLLTRTDEVDSRSNPIDNPGAESGADLGEQLFIWNSSLDIPKGDYDNVFFRIIAYGAVQGETAATSRFGMTKNAPVILRIQKPIQEQVAGKPSLHGNIVIPFYIQDSDSNGSGTNDLAKVVWEYGEDTNGDGKIIEQRDDEGNLLPGSEAWMTATQSPLATVELNGDTYKMYDQTTLESAATGNEDANGYPRGSEFVFIWDSVMDLGAPEMDPVTGMYSRKDVLIRGRPFDYPDQTPGSNPVDDDDMTAGIGMERAHDDTDFPFEIERDPEGLWIDRWYPMVNNGASASSYMYDGVKVDEAIRFEFTGEVEPTSINKNTLIVKPYGGGLQIEGYYHVQDMGDYSVVDFYPQAQELPARNDVLVNSKGYSLEIPAFDPSAPGNVTIERKGANADDTNARRLLTSGDEDMAFMTGTGTLSESVAPSYESMPLPTTTTNVATDTKTVELRFDDRLDPLSITPASFEVYAETFTGVKSVIPGAVLLSNKVDESGTGGALAKYGLLSVSLPPDMDLPPGSKITIVVKTGVTDLAGNNLSSQAMPGFETVPVTSTESDSFTEGFGNATYRDFAMTTAFWGSADPANPGNLGSNKQAGYLMGLFEFGQGTDGVFNPTSNQTLTSSASKDEWHYTSFNLASGRYLYLAGDRPITIRVQGDATLAGTVDGRGGAGQTGTEYTATATFRAGGIGVAGGGNGGGGGKYTYAQKSIVKGSDGSPAYGFSTGGGKAGSGIYSGGYVAYYTQIPGGGGGGHGAVGQTGGVGYYSSSMQPTPVRGAGGPIFGAPGMNDGPEGGAGGGPGAHYTTTYGWTGANAGGSGGAGGAGFGLIAFGDVDITSSGRIWCQGGNGGNAYNRYHSPGNYQTAGGGGGGGSGGGILLGGAELDISGELNVEGGNGGRYGYTTSYDNSGGRGAGGRIALLQGTTSWIPSGARSFGTSTVTCGGNYTTDWNVTTSVTVNTDTGSGGAGFDSTSGEFRVKNFTLAPTGVMTVTGTKPLKIIASGDVKIQGTIVAEGGSGAGWPDRNKYESYLSGNPWRIWYQIRADYAPGPTFGLGGPGGGEGGFNGSSKSISYSSGSTLGYYSTHTTLPNATDGVGWDGKRGGKGAGIGGKPGKMYTSGSSRYYYYGGSGGGGSNASPGGGDGSNSKHSTYGGGTSGTARNSSADLVDLSKLTPSTVVGGAGGGGGAPGGRSYVSGSYVANYPYNSGSGAGGGGGGIGICAKGSVWLGGIYRLGGGDGGEMVYSYSTYGGAGGGGSGGNLLVHSETSITFDGPLMDLGGGEGGEQQYYSYYSPHGYGGDGGPGSMRFTLPTALGAPEEPDVELDPDDFDKLGGGSLAGGTLALSTDGVSIFIDTEVLAPKNFEWTSVDNGGLGEMYLQGAMSHPLTGEADTANMTGWVKLGSGTTTSALNGYRYFRFKVVLDMVIGDYPEVDSVTINWEYDK